MAKEKELIVGGSSLKRRFRDLVENCALSDEEILEVLAPVVEGLSDALLTGATYYRLATVSTGRLPDLTAKILEAGNARIISRIGAEGVDEDVIKTRRNFMDITLRALYLAREREVSLTRNELFYVHMRIPGENGLKFDHGMMSNLTLSDMIQGGEIFFDEEIGNLTPRAMAELDFAATDNSSKNGKRA